jgi:hypothetical protein
MEPNMPVYTERRAAPRVACHLPMRISAQGRVLYAHAWDISRHGVGLRVPLEQLGLDPSEGMASVARRLDTVLADVMAAEFRYDVLGPLVRRGLRAVRIGRLDRARGTVELGCVLRTPLTDDELQVLGLDVPPATGVMPVPADDAEVAMHDARSGRWAAYVAAAPTRPGPPLRSPSVRLAEGCAAFVLDFPEARRLPLGVERTEAGTLLTGVIESYGPQVTLFVVEEERPLWAGPARVDGLEVHGPEATALRLHLSPDRPLSPGEQLRLGIIR